MTATITISSKLKQKIEGLAKRKDVSLEELIINTLDKEFSILDPDDRREMHLELCNKYLREAEDFISREDPVQASEKGWGAASQIVKAIAEREGKELRSHGELWRYVSNLRKRYNDEEIRTLWDGANSLHMNFYENWLPLDEVEVRVRDVKRFVEKLKGLTKGGGGEDE